MSYEIFLFLVLMIFTYILRTLLVGEVEGATCVKYLRALFVFSGHSTYKLNILDFQCFELSHGESCVLLVCVM